MGPNSYTYGAVKDACSIMIFGILFRGAPGISGYKAMRPLDERQNQSIRHKNTLQLWDRKFYRNSSLQAVGDKPLACITEFYDLIKYIGRRFPLELQCSLTQGQQGDVSQSVCWNYQARF